MLAKRRLFLKTLRLRCKRNIKINCVTAEQRLSYHDVTGHTRGIHGSFQFKSACKIWPLLELLAKIKRVLAKVLFLLACSSFEVLKLLASLGWKDFELLDGLSVQPLTDVKLY